MSNKVTKSAPKKKSVVKKSKQVVKKVIGKTREVKKRESVDQKTVYARIRYVPISAQKARLVIDMVRGHNAQDVVWELRFVRKKAALLVKKAIRSAIANAVTNFDYDADRLVISEAFVDDAPMLKRGRAESRGRYARILKRNSHITIGVKEK